MSSLRWMIVLIHPALLLSPTSFRSAATEIVRCGWCRRATMVHITHASPILVRLSLLWWRWCIVFPLPHTLWVCGAWSVAVSVVSSLFSCSESRSWWWCATSNSCWAWRSRMWLIWLMRSVWSRRRSNPIIHDRSDLWTRTVSPAYWWHWSVALVWWRWAIHVWSRWKTISWWSNQIVCVCHALGRSWWLLLLMLRTRRRTARATGAA